ncbi:MAG: DUF2993 domain-containing protein [Synergistaceae bacterium]|nr:DUF2993 domain-containing protein [Synergistaceae bacterium]
MKKVFAVMIMLLILWCSSVSVSYADEVDDLLSFYVKKFKPEKALLVISGEPDATGMFSDLYMDLKGVNIDKLRLAALTFRMKGVQFNEPSEWKRGNVECKSAMQVLAIASILESDINRSIENKSFGGGDHWHDVQLAINPKGLSGRGYYKAGIIDVLINIDSGLKIVKGKELWLNNPKVKLNKLDLPDYMTKQALSKIQPLVNLNKFPLPVTLHKVQLSKGSAVLSTRTLPKELSGGLRYSYTR